MLKYAFLLTTVLVLAPMARSGEPERFTDPETGLTIRVPEGWGRDAGREHGSVRFAGIYDLAPTKYVLFTVETGPARGFEPEAWLQVERAGAEKWLARVDEPFEADPGATVAGGQATSYVIGGQAKTEGEPYDLHIRCSGMVRKGRFVRICEVSYNKAHIATGKPLDRMWEGVSFQEDPGLQIGDGEEPQEGCGEDESEGCGEDEKPAEEAKPEEPQGIDLTPPPGMKPETVEDKIGNFKLTLPAGWMVDIVPQEDPEIVQRLNAVRNTASAGDVMRIEVFRFTSTRSETFTIDTPGDLLKVLTEEHKFFEPYFGEGSATVVRPRVDASVNLGGLAKSSAFEFRSITMQEQAKINEAQKLRARGDKTAVVPEYKPMVVRGRIALLSPHIYVARVSFRRDAADDPGVIAECKQLLDSWEFLSSSRKPPPLQFGGEVIGDTKADPALAKERDAEHVHETKGTKTYRLKMKFKVPPGFQLIEKGLGADASIALVAQDENNNWVEIQFFHLNANAAGEEHKQLVSKKQVAEGWKSNWESKARGVKMPVKPRSVKLGPIRGDGYDSVEGTVADFRGTFTAVLMDSKGWRTQVEMETRGDGDKVFEDGIKDFFKSLKIDFKYKG